MTNLFFKHPKPSFLEYRHSTNRGRRCTPQMHKTVRVGAIDKGEVIFQVERNRGILRPGRLAPINPETFHSCNPTEHGERSDYMRFLDVQGCKQVQQSLYGDTTI